MECWFSTPPPCQDASDWSKAGARWNILLMSVTREVSQA